MQTPHIPIMIAGDDDHHLELTNGVNPGKDKAIEIEAQGSQWHDYPAYLCTGQFFWKWGITRK